MDESVNTTNNEQNANPTPAEDPKPVKAKVFSEDYVKDLREENKEYRLRAKSREQALRKVLGLSDEDTLDNLDSKIEAFNKANEEKLNAANQKVNTFLINKAISDFAKDNYNEKLLAKVLDKSSITVGEDGVVSGVKEAIAEAEKEFPEIKRVKAAKYAEDTGNGTLNNPGESEAIKAFLTRIKFKD